MSNIDKYLANSGLDIYQLITYHIRETRAL
jgi:hypothetical protein